MIKITGFDKLQKELQDASKAMKALDGNIAKLKFDPSDRASVDAAIREMERAIDRKVAPYRNNAIVSDLAKGMKENYRASIRKEAEKARRSA